MLIDGDCVMCDRSARFIVAHAPSGAFRIAARASDEGRAALAAYPTAAVADALAVVAAGRVLVRSDAALAIARRLDRPWSVLGLAGLVPRPLRDAVYDLIARNRYRWFGRRR